MLATIRYMAEDALLRFEANGPYSCFVTFGDATRGFSVTRKTYGADGKVVAQTHLSDEEVIKFIAEARDLGAYLGDSRTSHGQVIEARALRFAKEYLIVLQ